MFSINALTSSTLKTKQTTCFDNLCVPLPGLYLYNIDVNIKIKFLKYLHIFALKSD